MRRISVALGWLLLIPAAVPILAAAIDHLHPALDSLGVGLIYGLAVALAAVVILLASGRWIAAGVGAGLLAIGTVQLLPTLDLRNSSPTDPLRLTQHNLNFRNSAPDLAARIADADLVTLQEVRAAAPTLAALDDEWTVQTCPFAAIGQPTVLTRLPVLQGGCLEGGAWLRIDTTHGPLTLVSLHLHWPWPFNQAAQVETLIEDLATLPRPIVVAGDFNQTPWSATVARIAAATGTAPIPSIETTLPLLGGLIRLNIDHVLIPDNWSGALTVTAPQGSDHMALTATLGPSQPK